MTPPQNILLIRLKVIGDVVLTLPACQAVRGQFPAAKISFLTSRENAPLLQGFPGLDEILTLDRAALRGGNPFRALGEITRLFRRLRAGSFDLVIDLQGYGETAWFTRLTGAPQRWGRPARPSRAWAYTLTLPPGSAVHPAAAHLELLQHGGLPAAPAHNHFELPAAARQQAHAFFAAHHLNPDRPTLFLQPFTSGAHKNWGLENYLAIARHWRARGCQILLGGGPGDRPALEPARQEGFAVAAGSSLLLTAGLMEISSVVLGGDTGMLHLAVALGRPVRMLMHQAAPGNPYPFQHREWVVAAPRPEAIREISPAQVNAALAEILNPQSA